MRKIYTIGETVYDIIFKDGQPQAAKAGGSMLNSVVSMGRLNLPVSFISEYGTDEIGRIIDNFLKDNKVNTESVFKFTEGKTSIAIALLNEKNDARYSFYKELPLIRLNIAVPVINEDDIVLYGSFYSIAKEVRPKFKVFIKSGRTNGAILIYDPNFRKAHLHEIEDLMPFIAENMQMATIIRGSNEDFKMMFNADDVDKAYEFTSRYCPILVYTCNSEGVYVRTPTLKAKFSSKSLVPVSTIGAGDNFNAGIIYALNKYNITTNNLLSLTENDWGKLVSCGVDLASEVCLGYDNYISAEFAGNYITGRQ
jgi:fructokinase